MEKEPSSSFEERDLIDLGFYQVLDIVAARAGSEPGRAAVRSLRPHIEVHLINESHDLVEEARQVLREKGYPPVGGLVEMDSQLDMLAPEGAYLEPAELFLVLCNLNLIRDVHSHLRPGVGPLLAKLVESISHFDSLIGAIDKIIENESEIRDRASAKLRRLRTDRRSLESRLDRMISGLLAAEKVKPFLRDSNPTIRGGRFVLPVRADSQGRVKGIVLDHSASGGTVYIEPMETVPLNNELRRLEDEERREIIRLLKEIAVKIRERSHDIKTSISSIAQIDSIFARAVFAEHHGCAVPETVNEDLLLLANARHPLLAEQRRQSSGSEVVPLFLNLGEVFRALLVTGPNAGGKTVALKTVGLMVLLNQSGIPVLADPDSRLGCFHGVFVDIGDGQSVENDLSTFSASMLNIARILRRAKRNSLVLLDELGAGTDPREGSVLGIEIVRGLVEKDAIVLATTHLGELKFFAGADKDIENGAMEFDTELLEPKYRLHVGMPGRSFGLQIARRSGLPESLINRAVQRESSADTGVDELLEQVDERLAGLREEEEKQKKLHEDLRARSGLVEKREREISTREERVERLYSSGVEQLVNEMRKDLERTVKEVREAGKTLTKSQILRARKKIAKYGELPAGIGERAESRFNRITTFPDVGDTVRLPDYDMTAQVIEVDTDRNRVKVERKGVVLDLPVDRISQKGSASGAEMGKSGKVAGGSTPKTVERSRAGGAGAVKTEMTSYPARLDVRGKTVEEAWMEVERAIDSAIVDGYDELVIIHGKGTGRLRAGLTERLKSDKRVRGVKPADFAAGGDGVSIISI